MKKIFLLAIVVLMTLCIFTLTSCGGSGDDEPTYNESAEKLKGTAWHYYKRVEHLAHSDKETQQDYYWMFLPDAHSKLGYNIKLKGYDSSGMQWYFSVNYGNHKDNLWITWDHGVSEETIKETGKAICCSCHGIISWTDDELVLGDSTHEIYLKRISIEDFNNGTGEGGGNNQGNDNSVTITPTLLCKNGGAWSRESSYNYELGSKTNYCTSSTIMSFSLSGTVVLQDYYERKESGYPIKTVRSDVNAIGTYQIQGNILKCVFTNVICEGESNINTRYWKAGETNYKNYKMECDSDEEQILFYTGETGYDLDSEKYFLTNNAGGSGTGGSGGNAYEAPDISYYDAEPGISSLKVTYRIWNKASCGTLSNAKIYYGKNSASRAISATISGDYITAFVTGLARGTEYKVKCSVKGDYGTATTEEVALSTLY